MALAIRLSRGGAKKRPYYRIVVADSRKARDGRYIERLGTYNPMLPKDHEQRVTLETERVKHWLGVGARPSVRVERFLDAAGLLKATKRNNPDKAKPGKKALERIAEKEEKVKAAEEAAKQAEEEAKAAAEAPAEEAPAEETATEEAATEAPAEEAAAEAPAEEAKAEEAPAEEAAKEAASEEKAEEEAKDAAEPAEKAEEKAE